MRDIRGPGITPRKIRVPDDRYIDYIWDPSYLLAGINNGDRIQAKDMPAHYQNLKTIGREIYYLYDTMSGPFKATSFSEPSESSSPEEIIEEIVVSKEKKDK